MASEYVTAQLIYGIIDEQKTLPLYRAIDAKVEENPTLHDPIRKKYNVQREIIGDDHLHIIYTYSRQAFNDINTDEQSHAFITIHDDVLSSSAEYKERLLSYLKELSIETDLVPGWHLLVYRDSLDD